MTICIAAIGKRDDEECIVFATDHMVTLGFLGQFEHSIIKYKELNHSAVAMIAGNPLIFDDLTKISDTNSDYDTIRNELFSNFQKVRKSIIQNEVLNVFDVDFEYVKNILDKSIPNNYLEGMLLKISEYKLNTSILLAGFSGNEAMITEINEENYSEQRVINFHAIGSGHIQALNTLMFQQHDKYDNILTTIYDVYKAKKNAEVAQGVGKETELLILCKGNGCIRINLDQIKVLDGIYYSELKHGRTNKNLSKLNTLGKCSLCS
jgi:hypothetical protein